MGMYVFMSITVGTLLSGRAGGYRGLDSEFQRPSLGHQLTQQLLS